MGQAVIVSNDLKKFEKFNENVTKFMAKDKPNCIDAICFVAIDWKGKGKDEFYFVEEPAYIPGFKFVSSSSPLGRAIKGKKKRETIIFKSGDFSKTGKIVSIE